MSAAPGPDTIEAAARMGFFTLIFVFLFSGGLIVLWAGGWWR